MLTYATLTNQHIPVESLPVSEWVFFCKIQDAFEQVWADLSNDAIPAADKSKKIEEFAEFVENSLKQAETGRTTRWPGANPLRLIGQDMIHRLVLRYEYLVTELKQQALQEIRQKTAEKFPAEAQQLRNWFKNHKVFSIPEDLIHQRIDTSEDWSKSGIPRKIRDELKKLAKGYLEQFPSPCPNMYPRHLSNVREATRQLVEELGGQFTVARKTGLNQGNLSKNLRASSETPLDTILSAFGRGIKFPRLRPQTERDGLEGEGAWLLFQEIHPSFTDAIHQHFAVRLVLLDAVLAASNLSLSQVFWKRSAQIESRFVYPTLSSGIRDDFLFAYEKFLKELREVRGYTEFGRWFTKSQKVFFLRIDEPIKKADSEDILLLLLPLVLSFLPAQGREANKGRDTDLIAMLESPPLWFSGTEVFLITRPDEGEILEDDEGKILEEDVIDSEWKKILKWQDLSSTFIQKQLERISQVEPHQKRVATALALRWWRALWSEGLLPSSLHRWTSLYKEFSNWIDSPDSKRSLEETIAQLVLPVEGEKVKETGGDRGGGNTSGIASAPTSQQPVNWSQVNTGTTKVDDLWVKEDM